MGVYSIRVPIIFTDELLFERLAVAYSRGEIFGHAGSPLLGFGFTLYPALISPLFWFPATIAYPAVKVLNSFLISSVCFPTYVLGRRLLPKKWGLVVAMMSLLGPGLHSSSFVMVESLYYPLTLAVVAAAFVWIRRTTTVHGLILAVLTGALLMTKIQGVLTAVSLGLLPILQTQLPWRERGKMLGRLVAVGALSGFLVTGWQWVRLGAGVWPLQLSVFVGDAYMGYLRAGEGPPFLMLARSWLAHVLALGSEIFPGVWLLCIASCGVIAARPAKPIERSLGVLAVVLIIAHAHLAVRQALQFDDPLRVHSRYLSELMPLVLLAAACVYYRHRPARAALVSIALISVAGLVLIAPTLGLVSVVTDCPGLSWFSLLHASGPWNARLKMSGVVGLSAALFLVVWGRLQWLSWSTAAMMAAASIGRLVAHHGLSHGQERTARRMTPLALRLHSQSKSLAFLVDDTNIQEYWYASFFSQGDGQGFCLRDLGPLPCVRVQKDAQGRLRAVESYAQQGFLIAALTMRTELRVVAAENNFVAYAVEGPVVLK